MSVAFEAQGHHHESRVRTNVRRRVAVDEQRGETLGFNVRQFAFGMHEMHEAARDRFDMGLDGLERGKRTTGAKVRKRATAREGEDDTVKGGHSCPSEREAPGRIG